MWFSSLSARWSADSRTASDDDLVKPGQLPRGEMAAKRGGEDRPGASRRAAQTRAEGYSLPGVAVFGEELQLSGRRVTEQLVSRADISDVLAYVRRHP
jgi:hypothetical protein